MTLTVLLVLNGNGYLWIVFQSSQIFESKAGAHPSGASYLGRNTIA
jgi:hypothetical protein